MEAGGEAMSKSRSRWNTIRGVMIMACLMFMAALGVALFSAQRSVELLESLVRHEHAVSQALNTLYAQGLQTGQALRNIVMDPTNSVAYRNHEHAIAEFREEVTRAMSLARNDAALLNALEEISSLRDRQVMIQARIVALALFNQEVAIATINKEETPVWREIRARLLDWIKKKESELETAKAEAIDSARRLLFMSIGLGVIAFLLGIWHMDLIGRMLGNVYLDPAPEPGGGIEMAEWLHSMEGQEEKLLSFASAAETIKPPVQPKDDSNEASRWLYREDSTNNEKTIKNQEK